VVLGLITNWRLKVPCSFTVEYLNRHRIETLHSRTVIIFIFSLCGSVAKDLVYHACGHEFVSRLKWKLSYFSHHMIIDSHTWKLIEWKKSMILVIILRPWLTQRKLIFIHSHSYYDVLWSPLLFALTKAIKWNIKGFLWNSSNVISHVRRDFRML